MKFEMKKKHWIMMIVIMIASAAMRIIPHPLNFAPIGGMALLGAAYIDKKWLAWIMPVFAFWISDLFLNNIVYAAYYDGFVLASTPFMFSAAAILIMVLVGSLLLKKIKIKNLILASLSASLIFFLVSNFGTWVEGILYPKTLAGLTAAYVAGLAFFKGTLIGNLVFTGVLFGVWELAFKSDRTSHAVAEAS